MSHDLRTTEFESTESLRPRLDLDGFLERYASSEFTRPISREFAHPLPLNTEAGAYLKVYARNFGDGRRGGTLQDVFTIARVDVVGVPESPPVVGAATVADPMHRTGAFRDLLYRLEVDLPRYGYREISVECVINRRLIRVLERYGFHRIDACQHPTMNKMLDDAPHAVIAEEAAGIWRSATAVHH